MSKPFGFFMAMLILMGASTFAHADSLCKNISFELKNNHDSLRVIKVNKVEYWDKEDNKWRTEDIKNIECGHGATCTTKERDLEYVGNEDIVKVRFHYQVANDTSGQLPGNQGPKWGEKVVGGAKFPEYPYCKKDKTFRKSPGQPFVIFGTN